MSSSYQKMRMAATKLVDKLYAEKKSEEEIVLIIEPNSGFGVRFVHARIEVLKACEKNSDKKSKGKKWEK